MDTSPLKKRRSFKDASKGMAKASAKNVVRAASFPMKPVFLAMKTMGVIKSQSRLTQSMTSKALNLAEPTTPANDAVTPVGSDASSGQTTPPITPMEDEKENVRDNDVSPPSPGNVGEAITGFLASVFSPAAAAVASAVTPAEAPVEAPPSSVEIPITKHGVPWRGSYARMLVVGGGRVVTIDPETREETNAWESPRDVPRALENSNDGTLELQVAPWPNAPSWLHQRIKFSLTGTGRVGDKEATMAALGAAGVSVERAGPRISYSRSSSSSPTPAA